VDDIVDGIIRAVEGCATHHLYNLGNSSPIDLHEMIQTIADAVGRAPIINRLPEQPGDVRQTYADISRAQRELGYQPKTSFREGIRRYVSWLNAQS
jgi:UDP-glucuronate 4-epimerase